MIDKLAQYKRLLLSWNEKINLIGPEARLLLTTGFLSAYTTFSSWMFESVQLIQAGNIARAMINIVVSIVTGLIAVYLGILVARLV